MPRKARIDAVGAVHYIIVRGIERHKIFQNDDDRAKFEAIRVSYFRYEKLLFCIGNSFLFS